MERGAPALAPVGRSPPGSPTPGSLRSAARSARGGWLSGVVLVWLRAVSSAGEHRPYKPEVAGSIPAPPTAAIAASRLTFPAARLRDLHLALGLGAGSGAGSFLGRAGEALHGVELVEAVSSTSFLPARGASQPPFCHLITGRPGR